MRLEDKVKFMEFEEYKSHGFADKDVNPVTDAYLTKFLQESRGDWHEIVINGPIINAYPFGVIILFFSFWG